MPDGAYLPAKEASVISDDTFDSDRAASNNHFQRNPMGQFDEIDRKLLTSLQENDRLPLAELGKSIGVATSTLNDRLKRLIRQGIVSGFHARLSPEALGLNLLAFVYVGWTEPKTEPAFLHKISKMPSVLECHHVTGAWNYLMKIRVQTTRDLEIFLAAMKAIEGVQRTETVIVLSTSKETLAVDVNF
jgi:Lrp/AsnC family transcriptional regulator, leucine-responsive regulatory protein